MSSDYFTWARRALRGKAVLSLNWRVHTFGVWPGEPTAFYDFVVKGHSLQPLANTNPPSPSSLLGGEWGAKYARQLLLREQHAELDTGRAELYVCPSCADLGCGSLTVKVERDGKRYVWSAFAREANYYMDTPGDTTDTDSYEGIGPLLFEADEYEALLEPLTRMVCGPLSAGS